MKSWLTFLGTGARWLAAALVALVVISCADAPGGGVTALDGGAGSPALRGYRRLATITVAPASGNVAVAGSLSFTAVGKDTYGNVVAFTPTWSVAGGGTISSSGVFTAGTVLGTYANAVRATSGSISGSASVTVVAGALATITLSPGNDTLASGGAQAFTAVGRDVGGNLVALTPGWSVVSGGGTITTAGLFTAGATAGTYPNTVRATSGGISGGATVTVTVVAGTPRIGLSPVSLSFAGQAGSANPAAQTLTVSNAGTGSMTWTATKVLGAAWLLLTPATGTAPSGVAVSVSLAGLAAGTYGDTIQVASAGVGNSPRKLPVSLTVTASTGSPSIGLSAASLSFAGQAGGATPAAQTLTISNVGTGTMTWTATKVLGAAWLLLTPASGTAPSAVTVSVSLAGLAAGTYKDTVQVAAAGAGNSPGKVPVSLTVASAPPPSGFATPDVLNNASFEAADGDRSLSPTGQWDGFINGSHGTPTGAVPSTDVAYVGSQAIKFPFSNTGADAGAQVFYDLRSAGSHLWMRGWFYGTAWPNGGGFKFFRMQDASFSGSVLGIQWLNGHMVWLTPKGSVIYITSSLPSLNTWHSLEVELDFGATQARVWLDGVIQTYWSVWSNAGDNPTTDGNGLMTYNTNNGLTFPGYLDIVRIINQCTNSGAWYWDKVAVSTLGRIGP